MWKYKYPDELYHYGILGMKWGHRKSSDDALEYKKLKKKKLHEMSNQELLKYNNRNNLERQYKMANPSTFKKVMLLVGGTAAALGTIANLQQNGSRVVKMGRDIVSKIVRKHNEIMSS